MEWNRWPLPPGKNQPFEMNESKLGEILFLGLWQMDEVKIFNNHWILFRTKMLQLPFGTRRQYPNGKNVFLLPYDIYSKHTLMRSTL
jgi:hypothetical protein